MQINGNAFQFAQLGIRRGMEQLDSAASTIASNSHKSGEITSALVALIESKHQVKSSVQVLEHADRAFDALLKL